jgi:putative ABC transport system substrate-binding protein
VIDRRTFIGTATAGALIVSFRVTAQRPEKLPRVALVFNNIPAAGMTVHPLARAFMQGLRDLGLVEGRNIMIERRSAEGQYERLPSLMQELLALHVDVIVTTDRALGAARRATDTIPIVAVGADELDTERGGAASLARPGRNLTGLSNDAGLAVNGKRLQLLKEAAPKTSRVAFLGQNRKPSEQTLRPDTEAAVRALGLTVFWVAADAPEELEAAFAAIVKDRADALFVDGTAFNYAHTHSITEFAARLRLPAIYEFREGPEAGGLMSYASNQADLFRRAATFVDKILKGAKPGDLPIEQPTKFELVINVKAARALSLAIPQSLLLRADEVIQ